MYLSGSALLDGSDLADLDLVALVQDVSVAAERLATAYPPLYPDQWRPDWAAFRDPGPPQVDIVLTVLGSRWDLHHRLAWELIVADAGLQDEYRRAKTTPEGKRAFFERVVRRLEKGVD